jgi:alpha-amylase
MTKKLNFVLGLHNHQPVGNMPWVIEKVYRQAYQPLLAHLEKHPRIKTVIHYSGILIEWLEKNHPDTIHLLKRLLDRGQIEINTGGIYEPVLAIIPDEDKVAQIREMTKLINRVFDRAPRGMWLAERVWEPHLAKAISQAGVDYTVLDDTHFQAVGLTEEELGGYFVTEELGEALKLFPASMRLRYLIPFAAPDEVLKELRKLRERDRDGSTLALISDDGEKFGSWPDTHKRVYEERWLEQFFVLLEENSEWLEMVTLSEYLERYPPRGRVYLPTASYTEMTEWALPSEMSQRFHDLISVMKKRSEFEKYKFLVKGGFFRNFLVKYPEANNLHKKMLYVSKKIREGNVSAALPELWKGQCNDAYWHGIFGGLYLPHLRSALYSHLIRAETIADAATRAKQPWLNFETFDYDSDGFEEVLVSTPKLNSYFRPSEGGTLFELDYKPKSLNLANTLTRTKEPYHRQIVEGPKERGKGISIHERSKVIDMELANYLQNDPYRRYSFIDHFFSREAKLEAFRDCVYEELGDFVGSGYAAEVSGPRLLLKRRGRVRQNGKDLPLLMEKSFHFSPEETVISVNYDITNESQEILGTFLGVELNLHFLGEFDISVAGVLQSSQKLATLKKKASALTFKDREHHLNISLSFVPEAELWIFPLQTVSQSEEGFERIYQSTVVVPRWELNLAASQIYQMKLEQRIEEGVS